MARSSARCPAHPAERAVEHCDSCGRAMCGECWEHLIDGVPGCGGCVWVLRQPLSPGPFVTVAIVLMFFWWLATFPLDAELQLALWIGASMLIGFGVRRWYLWVEAGQAAHVVTPRPPDLSPSTRAPGGSPYRQRLRHVARTIAPPLSGKLTTLVVGSALLVTAGVLPALLDLPRWLAVEWVIGSWWLIWCVAFSVLLFRGSRLARDFRSASEGGSPDAGFDIPFLESGDLGSWIIGFLTLAIFVVLAWALAEFAIPALLFGAYWLVLRALSRVANDSHGCESRPFRSLLWATVWATVYTAPLAGLVWIVHMIVGS